MKVHSAVLVAACLVIGAGVNSGPAMAQTPTGTMSLEAEVYLTTALDTRPW
jgi:hypothetical protein